MNLNICRSHDAHGAVRGRDTLRSGELLNAAERVELRPVAHDRPAHRSSAEPQVESRRLGRPDGSTKWTLVEAACRSASPLPLCPATPGSYVEVRVCSRRGSQSGSIHVRGWPCDRPQVVVNTRRLTVSRWKLNPQPADQELPPAVENVQNLTIFRIGSAERVIPRQIDGTQTAPHPYEMSRHVAASQVCCTRPRLQLSSAACTDLQFRCCDFEYS